MINKEKILIIGCGIISQNMHIPAITKFFKKENIHLVDSNIKTLKLISKKYNVDNYFTDINDIDLKNFSFILIALPYNLNFSFLTKLIPYNVKILCEKPVVSTYAEYLSIKPLLDSYDSEIFINQTRRFSSMAIDISQKIKENFFEKFLGSIKSIVYSDGSKFDWDSNSAFYFKNKFGVLLDRGPHALDLISWLIDEELELNNFHKDSKDIFPESHIHLDLISSKKKIPIDVTLSWKHKLANQVVVHFEKGKIVFGVNDFNSYQLHKDNSIKTFMFNDGTLTYYDLGTKVIHSFLNEGKDKVSFFDVENSIKLISEVYEK